MFDLLSDYNQTLENAVRFSAFKVAKQKYLDQGMSLEDAEQKAAVPATRRMSAGGAGGEGWARQFLLMR
jgi:hypothetical protein